MKTEIVGNVLYVTFYAGNVASFRIEDNCIHIRSTRKGVLDTVTVALTGDYFDRIVNAMNYLDSLA